MAIIHLQATRSWIEPYAHENTHGNGQLIKEFPKNARYYFKEDNQIELILTNQITAFAARQNFIHSSASQSIVRKSHVK